MIDIDDDGVAWVSFSLRPITASLGRKTMRFRLDTILALLKTSDTFEEFRLACVLYEPAGTQAMSKAAGIH